MHYAGMLSAYYISATLPVNYYEQPRACVPVDYTRNDSSLHVLINNLGIVWPSSVTLARTIGALDQIPSLC